MWKQGGFRKNKDQRKKIVRFPHRGSNPQCLALKPSALTITPRARLMVIRPIFLLFIFIDLFFKTTYAPVCQFVWKPLSGIRLGMEPSTKYQKHSPGIISSATLASVEYYIYILILLGIQTSVWYWILSWFCSELLRGGLSYLIRSSFIFPFFFKYSACTTFPTSRTARASRSKLWKQDPPCSKAYFHSKTWRESSLSDVDSAKQLTKIS